MYNQHLYVKKIVVVVQKKKPNNNDNDKDDEQQEEQVTLFEQRQLRQRQQRERKQQQQQSRLLLIGHRIRFTNNNNRSGVLLLLPILQLLQLLLYLSILFVTTTRTTTSTTAFSVVNYRPYHHLHYQSLFYNPSHQRSFDYYSSSSFLTQVSSSSSSSTVLSLSSSSTSPLSLLFFGYRNRPNSLFDTNSIHHPNHYCSISFYRPNPLLSSMASISLLSSTMLTATQQPQHEQQSSLIPISSPEAEDILSIFPYANDDDDNDNDDDDEETVNGTKNNNNTRKIETTNESQQQSQSQKQHYQYNNVNTTATSKKDPTMHIEWKRIVTEFTKELLDPSFVISPVRSSTIDAAKLYPQQSIGTTTGSNIKTKKSTLMPGSHKHLGGAYDKTDGCIYGVPSNSKSILCLYPITADGRKANITTDTVVSYEITTIPLPTIITKQSPQQQQFKWLRGIFAHGYMWAIPSWARYVLCVDIDAYWGRRESLGSLSSKSSQSSSDLTTEFVQLIPLPSDHTIQTWQWHGAGINQEQTAIYCIPSNAQQVLKVDLQTKTTSLLPIEYDISEYPSMDLSITNKWYGGIVGKDNCVYGIPYRAGAVLQINCTTDTATLIGPHYGCTHYYWHGGIQVNGYIYAHPSHANTVLRINTNTRNRPDTNDKDICIELPITRAPYDTDPTTTYKWLGGAVGVDGNVYCPACDTSAVLKINTKTNTCTTFGFAGTTKNKWQGGILGRDGCVYCIPASGQQLLRIATIDHPNFNVNGDDEGNRVQLIGAVPSHKDKWQGGYQGKDGSLYFIPENGYRVLKVTPPIAISFHKDGTMVTDDILVEML